MSSQSFICYQNTSYTYYVFTIRDSLIFYANTDSLLLNSPENFTVLIPKTPEILGNGFILIHKYGGFTTRSYRTSVDNSYSDEGHLEIQNSD